MRKLDAKLSENDRREIRAVIEAGRKTDRWSVPGNREFTTPTSGLRVLHAEEDGTIQTIIWKKGVLVHRAPTDGEI